MKDIDLILPDRRHYGIRLHYDKMYVWRIETGFNLDGSISQHAGAEVVCESQEQAEKIIEYLTKIYNIGDKHD